MNWKAIQAELEQHCQIKREYDRVCRQKEVAESTYRENDDSALRALQSVITRRANAAAKTLSDSWCVRVRVRPLVDHRHYTAKPFVTVSWACHGGRFDLEALITDNDSLTRFIRRLKQTIIINRDAPSAKQKV